MENASLWYYLLLTNYFYTSLLRVRKTKDYDCKVEICSVGNLLKNAVEYREL